MSRWGYQRDKNSSTEAIMTEYERSRYRNTSLSVVLTIATNRLKNEKTKQNKKQVSEKFRRN